MKNKIYILLTYILIHLNSNLFSAEDEKILKVGLLAPLSGQYEELGNSLLYSLQMALEEIDDQNVFIVPRDSGFNNDEKLTNAIKDLVTQNVNVIIGPISYQEFKIAQKFNNLIFISPSNINPEFSSNIISVGISLESQLIALTKFLKKQNRKKQ